MQEPSRKRSRANRLRVQVAKLRAKLHAASDPALQQLLLLEFVGALTALERKEAPFGSRLSNTQHRGKVAARHAEVKRDFAGALARYAPSQTAARPAPSSATTATV